MGESSHGPKLPDEGDDLHRPAALRTDQLVHFVDFPDHLCPAFGRDAPKLRRDKPERKRRKVRLFAPAIF